MASSSDPFIGRQLGNAVISAKLGEGGMGCVYRAHHRTLGFEVAVKVLRKAPGEQEHQYAERFQREGRAAVQVRHANVVQVMDAGVEKDCAYLVLELVEGSNLGDYVRDRGPLGAEETSRLGVQLAEGLAAIHAAGIVHRDIKPDNVLLSADGPPKIADLGLARALNEPELNRLTVTGMVVGTPYYLAPEAIRDSHRAGPPADIYSLGATLYQVLTGKPPFIASSPYDVMRLHLEERPRPLREVREELPAGLAHLVQSCLSKDPELRPSAEELAVLLRTGGSKAAPGSGLKFLALVVAAMVVALGAISWQVLGGPLAGDQVERHRLSLADPEPTWRWRVGSADWQQAMAPLALPDGTHEITVAKDQHGIHYRWQDTIAIDDSERTIHPDLQPVRAQVAEQELPVAGEGVLLLRGELISETPRWQPRWLGRHQLAWWTQDGCQLVSAEVREGQPLALSIQEQQPFPPPEVYLRHRVNGSETPAHHAISWWQGEHIRRKRDIDPTPSWNRQGFSPLQPASAWPVALRIAVEDHLRRVEYRLPTSSEAQRLSQAYNAPFYFRDGGSVGCVGGRATALALVAVVPMH